MANESARHDSGTVPTLIGLTLTDEIRNLRVEDDGTLLTSGGGGGGGGLTDAQLRATPVKVDDDATQTSLASVLSALASVPVTGVFWQPTQPVSGTVAVSSSTFTKGSVTVASSGNNTVYTPASGKKIRLYFFGYSAGASTTGNLVKLKFAAGGTVFDQQYLIAAGQPYARNIQAGKRYIDGGVDEPLVANLSASETVYVNFELEEI